MGKFIIFRRLVGFVFDLERSNGNKSCMNGNVLTFITIMGILACVVHVIHSIFEELYMAAFVLSNPSILIGYRLHCNSLRASGRQL